MNNLLNNLKIGLTMIALISFAGMVHAQDSMGDMKGMSHDHMMGTNSNGTTISVTGEVIDVACYTQHGGIGADHASCAEMCIQGGQPAGIVDADGKLFIILGEKHKSPADVVKGLEAKQVKATGKVIEKSGGSYLVVSKIEESKESKSSATKDSKAVYTCSMHPEITSDKSGNCPKCGMKLVLKKDK